MLIADQTGDVPIHLLPREAQVFSVGRADNAETEIRDGDGLTISVDCWDLTVESWEDAQDPAETWRTKKTEIHLPDHIAKSWREVSELGNAVSGIGRYTGHFHIPQRVRKGVVEIPLRDFVSVRLWINDVRVPVNLYRARAVFSGDVLKEGDNTIRIEVTSQLFNRLDADGAFAMSFGPPPEGGVPAGGVPGMDDGPMPMAVDNPPQNYGLTGPVKLTLK